MMFAVAAAAGWEARFGVGCGERRPDQGRAEDKQQQGRRQAPHDIILLLLGVVFNRFGQLCKAERWSLACPNTALRRAVGYNYSRIQEFKKVVAAVGGGFFSLLGP